MKQKLFEIQYEYNYVHCGDPWMETHHFSFFIEGKYYKEVMEFYLSNQHKNIKYRGSERELYHYPGWIFPHEELFHFPWQMIGVKKGGTEYVYGKQN